jgi:hypothetical protein
MKKQSKEQRDLELQQMMAEEGTRGRSRPVRAVNLELRRRLQVVLKLLADKNCDKKRYMAVIRDDFGLPDGSPEFLQYMKAWDEYR